ncbi:MAG: cobaltochelatase subunit CobN, partial [Deltaproteobacteria bacterium]|nr:cobaltochelatase subunit CobN [Deltaproteobacteria bacterium]
MLITILTSSGFYARLQEALPHFGPHKAKIFAGRALHSPDVRQKAVEALRESRINVIHASEEPFWEELYYSVVQDLDTPLVWLAMHNESDMSRSTVKPKTAMEILTYMDRGGTNNALYLLRYLEALVEGDTSSVPPPEYLPPHGLWHPDSDVESYGNIADYMEFYKKHMGGTLPKSFAGVTLHRHFWCVDKPLVETEIVRSLESLGVGVIPVFISGEDSGASDESGTFLRETFGGNSGFPKVGAIVKLTSIFQVNPDKKEKTFVGDDSPAHGSVILFRELNVPIFQPVISFRQNNTEWEKNPQGVLMELAWSVAMPEFEGAIEPIYIGGTEKAENALIPESLRRPHLERVRHLCERVAAWVRLSNKPISERKVAFILHNAPCASVEATVGTASRLDPFLSIKNILASLKDAGYRVTVPESSQDIITDIMEHKAIADFRWTTVNEIVGKGGAVKLLPTEDYLKWFNNYPETVRNSLIESWGNPPGEEIDEVPPAMVFEGNIVITGRYWGENALVMFQPKRGCAGSRCDGRVCLILQDPLIPPPHQYLASYRWLQEPDGFGADVIVHVGTHGNIEFLPGKSVGLSQSCYPDLALHHAPNVYIYNSDVTADGIIAKRRSYAAIVDHMQTVFTESGLYGDLAVIRELLGEWTRAQRHDGRRREIEGIIRQKITESSLAFDLKALDEDFETLAPKVRRILNETASSMVESGLHALGKPLETSDIPLFIYSILRFENPEEPSLRRRIATLLGYEWSELFERSSDIVSGTHLSGGEIVENMGKLALNFIEAILRKETVEEALKAIGIDNTEANTLLAFASTKDRILSIIERLEATDELASLKNAISGGYVTPGPSALIFRGREDVLPTGRNFYSRDPSLVPTRAAWKVGETLATRTVEKFMEEEGRYPKSISFFWISSDLVNCDGEEYSEMLALIGAKPVWSESGKVTGFEIIPKEKLNRPRIDLTIRMSGIIRDNFVEAVTLMDNAIKAVSELDEPDNYVREHTLENLLLQEETLSAEEKVDDKALLFKRAASRIYSNAPGSYSNGVYYAVMAS